MSAVWFPFVLTNAALRVSCRVWNCFGIFISQQRAQNKNRNGGEENECVKKGLEHVRAKEGGRLGGRAEERGKGGQS